MTAVNNIIEFCKEQKNIDVSSHRGAYSTIIKFCEEQAKELEKQQQGYSEEEARIIWRAGQEYCKTSGDSITFEELTEKFKNK